MKARLRKSQPRSLSKYIDESAEKVLRRDYTGELGKLADAAVIEALSEGVVERRGC